MAVTRNTSTTGTTNPPSINLSGGGYTNAVLVLIEMVERNASNTVLSTGATFNGSAMASAVSYVSPLGGADPGVGIWYIVNPSNVNAAPSVSGGTFDTASAQYECILLEGVDQTTPVSDTDSSHGSVANPSGTSLSLNGVADGMWLAGVARDQGAQTWTWSSGTPSLDSAVASFDATTAYQATTATTYTPSAVPSSATANVQAMAGAVFAAALTTTPKLLLLGVG